MVRKHSLLIALRANDVTLVSDLVEESKRELNHEIFRCIAHFGILRQLFTDDLVHGRCVGQSGGTYL